MERILLKSVFPASQRVQTLECWILCAWNSTVVQKVFKKGLNTERIRAGTIWHLKVIRGKSP